jgi:pimeloyl-ACP methyl ester carboxylesterase/predicted glycosyltransferase
MRARIPDVDGFAVRDGVRIHYEVFGDGAETIVFMPTWSIAHSRCWKAQVPHFARYVRVVTFDGRGNGLSDKDAGLDYSDEAFAADALAVLDATHTERASLVAVSSGARWALMLAARHPERVKNMVFIAPAVPLTPAIPGRAAALERFNEKLPDNQGWYKLNRHYWQTNYRDFLEFFFAECCHEPHSTKQIEDAVGWGLETTPDTLAATTTAPGMSPEAAAEFCAAVRCPVLVIHGDDDHIVPYERGRAVAAATGARLLTLPGTGHFPQARIPITINLAVDDFLELQRRAPGAKRRRRKRALFVSSPIGLGHAQRDVAIAHELRRIVPDVEIVWLAQHPVTEVLRGHGETIHPVSAQLVNESAHFESECAEHDLHAFQAVRRMDEIMVANFMLFFDLLRTERYDVVVGDEAWDIDHFLHEHPEKKTTAFAWLTDFVGFLPMPEGGEREASLTRDYNLEMIEHIDRHPRLRDCSIFVGDPEDVVPHRFADDLPLIRDWTQAHYDFSGYVTGFVPPSNAERATWRNEFGYRHDEQICIVTVGGSAAGAHLLRRIMASFPEMKRRLPALRMIVVAGPRIDPASLSSAPGLQVRAFVPDLYRHLAACDVAIVQGGLTTTMELTAARRPFLFFPLKRHFEQNYHVRHRLSRYRAGRAMDYDSATPETIADALVAEIKRNLDYHPVISDGAEKAAAYIGQML